MTAGSLEDSFGAMGTVPTQPPLMQPPLTQPMGTVPMQLFGAMGTVPN